MNGAVAEVAAEVTELQGTIGGIGAFAPGPDGVPVILLPDVQGLTMLRERIVVALRARGIESPSEHGFLPHMTLEYAEEPPGGDEQADLMGLPVTFAAVSVVLAGERTDHELTGTDAFTQQLIEHMSRRIDLPGNPSATTAGGMYATGTPEEIAAATGRASERLQSNEHVDPLAAAYQEVLERIGRRMAHAADRPLDRADRSCRRRRAARPQPVRAPDDDEVIDRTRSRTT